MKSLYFVAIWGSYLEGLQFQEQKPKQQNYHTFKKNIFEVPPPLCHVIQNCINMQNYLSGMVSVVGSRLLIIYIGLFCVANTFCKQISYFS